MFKRTDPDGWCWSCRRKRDNAVVVSSEPSASLTAQVKLGNTTVLRVCVVGDVVALTRGRIEERKVREAELMMPGGNLNHKKWHVTRTADSFISDCSTLTVPLRLLSELRAVLARIARAHPRAE